MSHYYTYFSFVSLFLVNNQVNKEVKSNGANLIDI